MKTNWYCVNVEFYDNYDYDEYENEYVPFTEIKVCMTEKQAVKKPNNQFKQVCGMTALKLWLTSEKHAVEMIMLIKSGETCANDLISFYEDCLPLERRTA